MDFDQEPGVVLLIVEDDEVGEHAFARRDRRYQALVPVPEVPMADDVEALRTALGAWPSEPEVDWESARYHDVCVVAFPSSPARTWVAAFFAAEMPWLLDRGALSFCVPPYDRRHTIPVTRAEATVLAKRWDRLRPPPSSPTSTRFGGGDWPPGPSVAVLPSDRETFHLRPGDGRRSFCGLRAKDLESPEPRLRLGDVPEHRVCRRCARHWFEQLRPEREEHRRHLTLRLEAVTGLLAAFEQLDALNRAVAAAADWPAAHAVLTGPPFGFTDRQAYHILTFPVGRQTSEGRADLEDERAAIAAGLTAVDAFLLTGHQLDEQ